MEDAVFPYRRWPGPNGSRIRIRGSTSAGVAKLVDAPGLGPGPERGGGSSPLARTSHGPSPRRSTGRLDRGGLAHVGGPLDDLVDEPVVLGLLRGEPAVAVRVGLDPLDRLTGVDRRSAPPSSASGRRSARPEWRCRRPGPGPGRKAGASGCASGAGRSAFRWHRRRAGTGPSRPPVPCTPSIHHTARTAWCRRWPARR